MHEHDWTEHKSAPLYEKTSDDNRRGDYVGFEVMWICHCGEKKEVEYYEDE